MPVSKARLCRHFAQKSDYFRIRCPDGRICRLGFGWHRRSDQGWCVFALQDAVFVASLLITMEAMVAEKPKKETAPAMPPGGMGGTDYAALGSADRGDEL